MTEVIQQTPATTSLKAQKFIGQSFPRKEDRRFAIGKGRFADDMAVPGLLHAAFVRSPHAHARIRFIDASAASKLPGVRALGIPGSDLLPGMRWPP